MERLTKIEELVEQGFQCLGMIHEARSKCILLKEKILKRQTFSIKKQILQIQQDLDTYSERLVNIHKELQKNGLFFKLE